jgi:hypothetical protein
MMESSCGSSASEAEEESDSDEGHAAQQRELGRTMRQKASAAQRRQDENASHASGMTPSATPTCMG